MFLKTSLFTLLNIKIQWIKDLIPDKSRNESDDPQLNEPFAHLRAARGQVNKWCIPVLLETGEEVERIADRTYEGISHVENQNEWKATIQTVDQIAS